jgi:hypothetical protein
MGILGGISIRVYAVPERHQAAGPPDLVAESAAREASGVHAEIDAHAIRQRGAPTWLNADELPAGDPDGLVFGWYPTARKQSWGRHACPGCGCSQAEMGPCWQCGRMVRP